MKYFRSMLLAAAAAAALALCAGGCATAAANAQKTEYALTQLADGAMKSWAAYHKLAAKDPASMGTTLDKLEQQHQQVNALAVKLSADLKALDSIIAAYATNSAAQPAVTAALNTVATEAPQILSLVEAFTAKSNILP